MLQTFAIARKCSVDVPQQPAMTFKSSCCFSMAMSAANVSGESAWAESILASLLNYYLPPAASINVPVTYEASLERSHRIALVTSSGCPPRCIGSEALILSTRPTHLIFILPNDFSKIMTWHKTNKMT